MKIDSHETDLYVLPESDKEQIAIIKYLTFSNIYWKYSFSNVKGQSWQGKCFIEIPFRIDLKESLQTII